ncbi:hypothetical protein ES703_63127 [subsurface metagenome]
MSKKRVRRVREPPVVIKVTVSNGQAKINLPKKTAVRLNLMTDEGEPGSVTHLLVSTRLSSVGLQPVEILAIEAE